MLGGVFLTSCGDSDDDDTSVNETSQENNNATSEEIAAIVNDSGSDVANYSDVSLPETTLWIVGDSTVSDFSDSYFYPRYGYGTQIGNYLSSKITVTNLALSGRSSKSFITESNYTTLTSGIKAGDFLIIGFGHNDEKSDDEARFTDASKPTTDSLSFKYSLYENYVKLATEKGATPILCSPIVRLAPDDNYTGTNAHVTSTGDYGKAIVELGSEKNVQVVDLTSITKAIYTKLGYDEAIYFHAMTSGSSDTEPNLTSVDKTHINIYGAKMVCAQIAKVILASDCALKPYIKTTKEPTKAVDLVKNPSYKYVPYTAVDWSSYKPDTNFTTISEDYYGTAFGVTGSANVTSKGFVAKETNSGVFEVGQTDTSGKISSSGVGIAFCFRQVPIDDNFTITAKATVTTAGNTKQTGFGLMLRDDCYIPTQNTGDGNFVAAGIYTSDSESRINFSLASSTLANSGDSVSGLFATDDTANFTITRVGQVVTVTTVYKETSYSTTYTDFDFVAKDKDYMYVGMFGTRGTVVKFTNVTYKKTGTSQGA